MDEQIDVQYAPSSMSVIQNLLLGMEINSCKKSSQMTYRLKITSGRFKPYVTRPAAETAFGAQGCSPLYPGHDQCTWWGSKPWRIEGSAGGMDRYETFYRKENNTVLSESGWLFGLFGEKRHQETLCEGALEQMLYRKLDPYRKLNLLHWWETTVSVWTWFVKVMAGRHQRQITTRRGTQISLSERRHSVLRHTDLLWVWCWWFSHWHLFWYAFIFWICYFRPDLLFSFYFTP